jgi:crossover junction endodeoxyribonuclease RusA
MTAPDPELVRAITDPLPFGRNPFLEPLPDLPAKWAVTLTEAPIVFDVFVHGTPAPKGSKTAKGRRANGSAILVESAAKTLVPWAERVERAARESGVRLTGPAIVIVAFHLRRPARPTYDLPAVKPDVDKLVRAVFDALEAGGVLEQDARVVEVTARKCYALSPEQTGAHILARRYEP